MLTIYGMSDSGNCYKVRLAAEQLQVPYRWVETDSSKGETHSPAFLAMNPNGKVPTVRLDDSRTQFASFTAAEAGTYVFRLTVTDARGATSDATVSIVVSAATSEP